MLAGISFLLNLLVRCRNRRFILRWTRWARLLCCSLKLKIIIRWFFLFVADFSFLSVTAIGKPHISVWNVNFGNSRLKFPLRNFVWKGPSGRETGKTYMQTTSGTDLVGFVKGLRRCRGAFPGSSFRVIVLAITFKYRRSPCRSCLRECCARTEDGSRPTCLNYNGNFRMPNSRQFRFWAVRFFPFTKLFKTQTAQRCMQSRIGKNVTLHSFDFVCSVCFPVSQYDQ